MCITMPDASTFVNNQGVFVRYHLDRSVFHLILSTYGTYIDTVTGCGEDIVACKAYVYTHSVRVHVGVAT